MENGPLDSSQKKLDTQILIKLQGKLAIAKASGDPMAIVKVYDEIFKLSLKVLELQLRELERLADVLDDRDAQIERLTEMMLERGWTSNDGKEAKKH